MTVFLALLQRELQLLYARRMQLAVLACYPLLLLLTGGLALDLPQQGDSVRVALLLIAFMLLPLHLVGTVWQADLASGVLLQLRQILLSAVWARLLALLLGVLLPLALLLLAAGTLLLVIDPVRLMLPLLLTLPSLTGLLLLVAALVTERGQSALSALLLLPLAVPLIVLLTLATTGTPELMDAACWWLGAVAALSLGLLPMATTAALRLKLAA